jgi:hypothetical protein
MPFRFYRRVRILPGVHLNLSKRGVSCSLGERGAQVTVGTSGAGNRWSSGHRAQLLPAATLGSLAASRDQLGVGDFLPPAAGVLRRAAAHPR